MEFLLPLILVFVIVLAILGLCAGVSNDACNFMSSAVGTKSASYRTVTIIAAIGVISGATTSNGMMEIARNGVMAPEFFYANEVIFIFLSVVISNLILLDIFNKLGLPTSTSVSLVFELLGATFAMAIIKTHTDNVEGSISQMINTDKALTMILGIFLSVAIAFVFSIIIQYITRLIFTFNYKKNLKWKIGIFGGIATTALVYFMLIKGLKGASFMTKEVQSWIDENTLMLLGCIFIFLTILMQLLYFLKVNVLKVIVLIGTFALAMAFAGNDLVNFIGVPLACLDTYISVKASGLPLDQHLMFSLNGSATASFIYILIAGIIMAVTLLTSKKAKIVLQTSLDLSKQNAGDEQFGSSHVARSIVRITNNIISAVNNAMPNKVKVWIDSRFNQKEAIIEDDASFDLIRGLVSIVLASMIIALGTSLKLPLSTTYVAFMVTMGASLADRAWSRESAVFRVTGMFSVIGGWFITAIAALLLSFIIVLIFHYTGVIGILVMIGIAMFIVLKDINGNDKNISEDPVFDNAVNSNDKNIILNALMEHNKKSMTDMLDFFKNVYINIIDAFAKEDIKTLRKLLIQCKEQKNVMKVMKRKEIQLMRKIDENLVIKKNTWFHLNYNCVEQILYSLRRICDPVKEYVDNSFTPLNDKYLDELNEVKNKVLWAIDATNITIYSADYKDVDAAIERIKNREDSIMAISMKQMNRIQDKQENIDLSLLYLNIIQESFEIVVELRHILRDSAMFNEKTL